MTHALGGGAPSIRAGWQFLIVYLVTELRWLPAQGMHSEAPFGRMLLPPTAGCLPPIGKFTSGVDQAWRILAIA